MRGTRQKHAPGRLGGPSLYHSLRADYLDRSREVGGGGDWGCLKFRRRGPGLTLGNDRSRTTIVGLGEFHLCVVGIYGNYFMCVHVRVYVHVCACELP